MGISKQEPFALPLSGTLARIWAVAPKGRILAKGSLVGRTKGPQTVAKVTLDKELLTVQSHPLLIADRS